MTTYNVNFDESTSVLTIGFGEPANNDQIVKDAVAGIKQIKEQLHGAVLKVNGAASLPVGFALSAELAHVVKAIAVFDPKLKQYVVAVTHDPSYSIGALID
ncbi:MAG: CRISPR-associated protein Csx3 [Calothrix sp. FI2-JRJ7]|jgi:CRISPR-associated protein Csx3|nr:CRISPR-associated protein Csx3 [Calothrix sp. FI2-JRJ7]